MSRIYDLREGMRGQSVTYNALNHPDRFGDPEEAKKEIAAMIEEPKDVAEDTDPDTTDPEDE